MASESTRPSFHSSQAQTELELLKYILDDELPYPWNPADSESYFADLEQQVAAEWSSEELVVQGRALASHLDQLWASLPTAPADTLQARLMQQFAAKVPQHFLEKIAQRAQQMLTENLSVLDQMVGCVRDLVPGLEDDDLRVLARHYAPMRSMENLVEATQQSARQVEWAELSSVEQAKFSLAVARYAIAHLPSSTES